MDYNIVSSSSKGNCVIINDLMIDCGVPFKQIEEYILSINILLITHRHSDHVKPSTLKRIQKMNPNIVIICNVEVAQVFDITKALIITTSAALKLKGYIIQAFECNHDVLTFGYVWKYEKEMYIYATDTANLDNAPVLKYDHLFIESNHDEKKVQHQINNGNMRAYDSMRHLSKQKAKAFYYTRRKSRESLFVELHKSDRFY